MLSGGPLSSRPISAVPTPAVAVAAFDPLGAVAFLHSPDRGKPIPPRGRWRADLDFNPIIDALASPDTAPFRHSPDKPKPIPAQGRAWCGPEFLAPLETQFGETPFKHSPDRSKPIPAAGRAWCGPEFTDRVFVRLSPVKHSPDRPKPIPAQGVAVFHHDFIDQIFAHVSPLKHCPDLPKPIPPAGRWGYHLDYQEIINDLIVLAFVPQMPLKNSPDRPKPIPAPGTVVYYLDYGPIIDALAAPTTAPYHAVFGRPHPLPEPGWADYALDYEQYINLTIEPAILPLKDSYDRPKPLPGGGRSSEMPILSDHFSPGSHLVAWTQSQPRRPAATPRADLATVDLQGVLADLPAPTAFLVQSRGPARSPGPLNRTRQTDAPDLLLADERAYYAAWTMPTRPRPLPAVGRGSVVQDTLELMLDEARAAFVWVGSPGPRPSLPVRRVEPAGIVAQGLQPAVAVDVIFSQQLPPKRLLPAAPLVVSFPPWHASPGVVVPGPFWVAAGQVTAAAGAVQGDVRDPESEQEQRGR